MKQLNDNPFAVLDKQLFPKSAKNLAEKKNKEAKRAMPMPQVDAPNEEAIFLAAMDKVNPLGRSRGRSLAPSAHNSSPPQKAEELSNHSIMLDVLDGKIEFRLDFTDEYIEGRVKGFDDLTMAKLKAGALSPEAHLDLHGLNMRQAYAAMLDFIQRHYMAGRRCLLLIPGRGRNSPEGCGILRSKLRDWLTADPFKRVVLAFCTAKPKDGGMGALYVLLRQYRKSRSKIYWERYLLDSDLF